MMGSTKQKATCRNTCSEEDTNWARNSFVKVS